MKALLIALRRGSAPLAVPAMIALGLFAGSRGGGWSVDWGWTSGQLQQHGVLLVPVTAALAAWDVSRDRRNGTPLLTRTYPRSPLTSAMLNCVGALLAGLAGWTATFLVMAASVRGGGEPYWSVVLLGPCCVVAAVFLGAVAGRHLPRYLAAPFIAVAVWLALAFGSSSPNAMVARLSAVNRDCCDVSSQPVGATVVGQWLWIAGLVVAAAAVLALPDQRRGIPLALAAAMSVATGIWLIGSSGAQMTEPRTPTAEACRTQDGTTVCMWPEHTADVEVWLNAVTRFRALFADLGEQPQLYVENGLRAGTSDAVRIGPLRAGRTENDLVTSLAQQGLMPPPPACAGTSGGSGFFPAASARALLHAWLVQRVEPEVPSSALVPEQQVTELDRLRNLPAEQQRQWYQELVRAHQDCSTPAPRVP